MNLHGIFIMVALAIFNGIYSPFLTYVYHLSALWYPSLLPSSLHLRFFASSLIVSTLTMMLAGVPAAGYEHFCRYLLKSKANQNLVMAIWIAATATITLPAVNLYLNLPK